MIKVWRLVTSRRVNVTFTGEGALRYGGRWNKKGTPIVYTAESRALALLEMLVQDEPLRARHVLIPAEIPDGLTIETIESRDLRANWRTLPGLDVLKEIGTHWAQSQKTVVLAVPSAIIPEETNYLLNPLHPEFRKIKVRRPASLVINTSLIEKSRGE